MTLDQFLDEYVPNVLRPMGGWHLTERGMIRRVTGPACHPPGTSHLFCECPLEAAVAGATPSEAAHHLGIAVYEVMGAADHGSCDIPECVATRARLLAGLGLTEGK